MDANNFRALKDLLMSVAWILGAQHISGALKDICSTLPIRRTSRVRSCETVFKLFCICWNWRFMNLTTHILNLMLVKYNPFTHMLSTMNLYAAESLGVWLVCGYLYCWQFVLWDPPNSMWRLEICLDLLKHSLYLGVICRIGGSTVHWIPSPPGLVL